jgi:hypothetical protein
MATKEISPDQIQELLSKARTRGDYKRELVVFLNGDEKGVQIDLENGTFAGKKPESVKIGFDNARKAKDAPEGAEDGVRVVLHEKQVYLLRTETAPVAEEA